MNFPVNIGLVLFSYAQPDLPVCGSANPIIASLVGGLSAGDTHELCITLTNISGMLAGTWLPQRP